MTALAAGFALLIFVGVFTRDAYADHETDPHAFVGTRLAALGVHDVSVDARTKLHSYARVTFFGATAVQSAQP